MSERNSKDTSNPIIKTDRYQGKSMQNSKSEQNLTNSFNDYSRMEQKSTLMSHNQISSDQGKSSRFRPWLKNSMIPYSGTPNCYNYDLISKTNLSPNYSDLQNQQNYGSDRK